MMNAKFCFLASLAFVGSISLTTLTPQSVDASKARAIQEGAESLVRGGAAGSALGVMQQNGLVIVGGLAALGLGGIGLSIMNKK